MNTRQMRGRSLPIVILVVLVSVLALTLAFISAPTTNAEVGSDRTADYVASVDFTPDLWNRSLGAVALG